MPRLPQVLTQQQVPTRRISPSGLEGSPVQYLDPAGNRLGDPRRRWAPLVQDPLGIQLMSQAKQDQQRTADQRRERDRQGFALPFVAHDPKWAAWLAQFGQLQQASPQPWASSKQTVAGARGQDLRIPTALGEGYSAHGSIGPRERILRQARRRATSHAESSVFNVNDIRGNLRRNTGARTLGPSRQDSRSFTR